MRSYAMLGLRRQDQKGIDQCNNDTARAAQGAVPISARDRTGKRSAMHERAARLEQLGKTRSGLRISEQYAYPKGRNEQKQPGTARLAGAPGPTQKRAMPPAWTEAKTTPPRQRRQSRSGRQGPAGQIASGRHCKTETAGLQGAQALDTRRAQAT